LPSVALYVAFCVSEDVGDLELLLTVLKLGFDADDAPEVAVLDPCGLHGLNGLFNSAAFGLLPKALYDAF
jgi:hypothetical protein